MLVFPQTIRSVSYFWGMEMLWPFHFLSFYFRKGMHMQICYAEGDRTQKKNAITRVVKQYEREEHNKRMNIKEILTPFFSSKGDTIRFWAMWWASEFHSMILVTWFDKEEKVTPWPMFLYFGVMVSSGWYLIVTNWRARFSMTNGMLKVGNKMKRMSEA